MEINTGKVIEGEEVVQRRKEREEKTEKNNLTQNTMPIQTTIIIIKLSNCNT